MGISDEVACSLEDKLQKQLSLAIQKKVDKLQSTPKSPVASDIGICELLGDWEEEMKEVLDEF